MKIIIIGAGELGQMLAEKLRSLEANDLTVVDSSEEELKTIQDNLDVMTTLGDATNVAIMKQAGIQNADLLLAVSGDQASNMLACRLAKKFGVKECICRIYSNDAFSEEDGITPEFYGIDKSFSSPVETLRHLLYILRHQLVIEHVEFSNPDATMVTIVIDEDSPLKGVKLQDIPDKDLLAHIRFAALVRDNQLKYPHGEGVLLAHGPQNLKADKEDDEGDKEVHEITAGQAARKPQGHAGQQKKKEQGAVAAEDKLRPCQAPSHGRDAQTFLIHDSRGLRAGGSPPR